MTASNGCQAGTGNDTINFGVTGTITINIEAIKCGTPQYPDTCYVNQLPSIEHQLTIQGPPAPGIIISGSAARLVTLTAATLDIKNITFSQAPALDNLGTLTVSNTTFDACNNEGSEGGGAITNSGIATVLNSSFVDNQVVILGSGTGGAILNTGSGQMTIINTTFFGNVAGSPFSFARVATIDNLGETPIGLKNSIIANTVAAIDSHGASDCGSGAFGFGVGVVDLGYNIADDNSCPFDSGTSQSNTTLMLDPAGLANNGGPTQTIALAIRRSSD